MNAKKVYCNVCALFLNSSDQYAMHLLGKQHARKTQISSSQHEHDHHDYDPSSTSNISKISVITVSDIVNSSSTNMMNSYNQQQLISNQQQMGSYQQQSFSTWLQPTSEIAYQQMATLGTASEASQNTASYSNNSNIPVSESITPVMSSEASAISQTATTSNPSQKDQSTQPKVKKSRFCSVCLVTLTSQIQADIHFSGTKHKRTLAMKTQSIIAGEKRKREEYCAICNIPLSSSVLAEAHYAGSKHEKKLKLMTAVNTATPVPVSSHPVETLNTTTEVVAPTSTTTEVSATVPKVKKELDAETKAKLFCSCCNLAVNSLAQMTAHQSGKQHKLKARQLPSQRAQPYHIPTNKAASNFAQKNNSQRFIPDLKSSFIFGETTHQNISF
ncbi:zinc finger protein 385B-like isoform X2 [Biomphalaria glabrata]|uniref:Zinc finger protein 385B-like isoform X2 n=1 Tax=Biomphalaria glabrata TaxID=6526 RepID=A0A9U8ECV2_BIOGL|nr:zinc finger protein 385B-like isoform X2 [Biomphalaria glabrata]